jgi:hypothetical protein
MSTHVKAILVDYQQSLVHSWLLNSTRVDTVLHTLPSALDPESATIPVNYMARRGRGRPRKIDRREIVAHMHRLLADDFNRDGSCKLESAVETTTERFGIDRATVFAAMRSADGWREY